MFINGKKVNEDVLSPAVSQFYKRSLTVTYDVIPLLKTGNNDVIIWLGSGWYTQELPGVTGNDPVVELQMEHIHEGSKEVAVCSDPSWMGRESECSRIIDWVSGRYDGEMKNMTYFTVCQISYPLCHFKQLMKWKKTLFL